MVSSNPSHPARQDTMRQKFYPFQQHQTETKDSLAWFIGLGNEKKGHSSLDAMATDVLPHLNVSESTRSRLSRDPAVKTRYWLSNGRSYPVEKYSELAELAQTPLSPVAQILPQTYNYKKKIWEDDNRWARPDQIPQLQKRLNSSLVQKVKNSKGYVPNFADPLTDAIQREQSYVPNYAVRVGRDQALSSAQNPLGLGVYNTFDEPMGLQQGVTRAKSEGRNPKTYGLSSTPAAKGNVPNFKQNNKLSKKASKWDSYKSITDKQAYTNRFINTTLLQTTNNNDH